MEKNNITINKDKITLSVSVFLFRENSAYIAYCPSLDLSGYDTTEQAAQANLKHVLNEWLNEQVESGTLVKDLQQHGWQVKKRTAAEPAMLDILRHRSASVLKNILNMREYVRTNIKTEVAAAYEYV